MNDPIELARTAAEATQAASQIAQEHAAVAQRVATELEGLLATIKTRLEELEDTRAALTNVAVAADGKLAELAQAATSALATKTQINDEQAVIATKSAHIQSAQEHADKVRAEIDRIHVSATQQATETEGLRARAQTAMQSASELLSEIRGQKATADSDVTTIAAARETARAAAETTKGLADKAVTIEQRIADYEARLAALEAESKAKLETIVGFLPGATSAGLAHSFDDRRKTFLEPGKRWQWLFVGSLAVLVLLALSGLWNVYRAATPLTWDELGRLWLARLPIAGALIWLALHASRESALAKRLEEDYGYKAVIAASFQGFQNQMAEIGASAQAGSPLSKLCDDTLATISSPPGRIYEKHHLVVSPSGELASAAAKALGAEKKPGSAAP